MKINCVKVILYLSRRMNWYAHPPYLLSSLVEILCKIYSHNMGHLFHGNQRRDDHILTFLGTCGGAAGGVIG